VPALGWNGERVVHELYFSVKAGWMDGDVCFD
jgi:hypothetical protein